MALLVRLRGAHRPHPTTVGSDAPGPRRLEGALDRRLTIHRRGLAGPATHIPGLFYLIALNVIVAHNAALAGGRWRC